MGAVTLPAWGQQATHRLHVKPQEAYQLVLQVGPDTLLIRQDSLGFEYYSERKLPADVLIRPHPTDAAVYVLEWKEHHVHGEGDSGSSGEIMQFVCLADISRRKVLFCEPLVSHHADWSTTLRYNRRDEQEIIHREDNSLKYGWRYKLSPGKIRLAKRGSLRRVTWCYDEALQRYRLR